MQPTAILLLWPLAAFVVVLPLHRIRRLGALIGVLALAVEAYACLRLPAGAGIVVLDRTVYLQGAGRMALAWAAGASAVLALTDAVHVQRHAVAPALLILTSIVGLSLAVEPLPLAPFVLWLAVPVLAFLFRPASAYANRGVSRALILTAVALPAFLIASLLISRTPALNPLESPPWATVAVLVVVAGAAWLSLFPFQAWSPGVARSGDPLGAGWVLAVFQPLVLVTIARVISAYPDLNEQATAHLIVLPIVLGSLAAGAVFAASGSRVGQIWGYSSVTAMAWLFATLFFASGSLPGLYWAGVAGYSVSGLLVASGLSGLDATARQKPLSQWTGIACGSGASVALLLVGGLALCGLPVAAGFWTYAPQFLASLAVPTSASLAFRIAPLVAGFDWWRILWTSVQRPIRTESEERSTRSWFLWALVAMGAASFIWSGVWVRFADAFARALSGG